MNRRLLSVGAVALAGLGLLGTALAVPRGATPVAGTAADTAITSRSIAFFEGRLAADPTNSALAGQLSARYIQRFGTGADLADVDHAERLARRILANHPDRGQSYARLSGILLARHRFSEAMAAADSAQAAAPTGRAALGAVFDAALASGDYRRARSALHALPARDMATRVRQAQWLSALGHSDQAFDEMAAICRAIAASEVSPVAQAWCLTELAKLQHTVRGPDEAARGFQRALAIQPDYRAALEGLASLAAAAGDWAAAESRYRRITSEAHPDLYLRLSEMAAARGLDAERRRWEQRFLAVAGRPEDEALYGHELALYYVERGDDSGRDRALAIARREVARRPTVESWDLLGWVQFRRGELDAALQASDRAVGWGGPSPTMWYHRARILDVVGRESEGARAWALAVADPTMLDPHARRALSLTRD